MVVDLQQPGSLSGRANKGAPLPGKETSNPLRHAPWIVDLEGS
jgi:hypothetical protein